MCTSVYVFSNSAWLGRKKQISEDAYVTQTHERVMCVDNGRTSVLIMYTKKALYSSVCATGARGSGCYVCVCVCVWCVFPRADECPPSTSTLALAFRSLFFFFLHLISSHHVFPSFSPRISLPSEPFSNIRPSLKSSRKVFSVYLKFVAQMGDASEKSSLSPVLLWSCPRATSLHPVAISTPNTILHTK